MYARLCWKHVLLIAMMICASAAFGQTPAVEQQPANGASGEPVQVLKMTSNLVLVDVVVTNHDKAVHGLDRSKFHLFENGNEQMIAAFDEHQPGAVPAALPVRSPLPPHVYNNLPTYPATGVVNVLLLDGLNTPATDQMRARQQMVEYMGKIQPGTPMAVFTLTSKLSMVTGFTTDVAQLTKAVKGQKVEPNDEILLNGSTVEAGATPWSSTASAIQQFAGDNEDAGTDVRTQMTLVALKQLGLYLSAIPGRKNLIWFSGSSLLSLNPQFMQGSGSQGAGAYAADVRQTDDLLVAARVAVYPVDARGLMTMPGFGADQRTPQGAGMFGVGAANTAFEGAVANDHAAMRQIAEATGGQAFINTNGLKEAIADAVENGASYYTIAYSPIEKKLDGQFRKIQVRLDASGYQLSYRRGYYADPPGVSTKHSPGATSMYMASTLHGAPPASQVLFLARVLPADDPQLANTHPLDGPAGEMTATLKGPTHRILVDVRIDPSTLAFKGTPVGLHQVDLECTLVGYDKEGKRLNWESGAYSISLKADEYARVLAQGLPVSLALDLPAGQEFLRIAVHDKTADHAGSLEVRLAVAGK